MRQLRRPLVLALVSFVCLLAQHVLLRVVEHAHVAHVLLGAGNQVSTNDAVNLAIALLVARFVAFVLVPGMMLAAAAELLAYLLVGPPKADRGIPEEGPPKADR